MHKNQIKLVLKTLYSRSMSKLKRGETISRLAHIIHTHSIWSWEIQWNEPGSNNCLQTIKTKNRPFDDYKLWVRQQATLVRFGYNTCWNKWQCITTIFYIVAAISMSLGITHRRQKIIILRQNRWHHRIHIHKISLINASERNGNSKKFIIHIQETFVK